ncbi:unnamed protein product, partial [Laminaria digitata]
MPLEDLLKKSDTTDYDESVVKFMPTYPGLSLTSHVVLKNVQVWSLGASIGSIAACGMWLKGPEPGFPALVFNKWPRYAGVGGAVGVLTASAMMYMKMKTIDLGGLEDRSYRIAVNKGVQTIDFYSAIGGVTCLLLDFSRRRVGGGGVGAGAKRMLSPWSLMAQGIAAGSVGYTLGNAVGLPVQK